MKTFSKTLEVKTTRRNCFLDITDKIVDVLRESEIKDGIVNVFVPHTTCGILLNENYDPTVQADIQKTLTDIAPEDRGYSHREGNADSHIKTAIVGNSVTMPVFNGKIPFGTWQGIFLAEFDGPRTRRVIIKILGE